MKSEIIKVAETLGISEIGFVSAEAFEKKEIYSSSEFAKSKLMTKVSEIMCDAKTIIVWLAPYKSKTLPENLSLYAMGKDYHLVCFEYSEKICNLLRDKGYKAIHMTDDNPLCERELARDAGLGSIGKNGFLINPRFGSYVFISCIITDCFIEASENKDNGCSGCGLCISSCPGGALTNEGFDEKKCASYITQKKGELTESECSIIKKSGSVWGCDICQNVCPMNKNTEYTNIYAFSENLITNIKPEVLSGRQFKKKYSDRAFSWRGKAILDRNMLILNEKHK